MWIGCSFSGRFAPKPPMWVFVEWALPGRFAPGPPIGGTETGSPAPPPAKKVVLEQPDLAMPQTRDNREGNEKCT